MKWMRIDSLDLPKLTTLRTRDYSSSHHSFTFRDPRHITLESDSHSLWMMFRHAQSHRCGSSKCIQVQEWRHNQRQYSLHSSLTNRHRGSLSIRIIWVLHEHSSWFWWGDGLSGWKWCMSICECDFIWLECVSESGDTDNWWLQFLLFFIGIEEYSHSFKVMTRHAFSQITRFRLWCIRGVLSCCVWEWLTVMWMMTRHAFSQITRFWWVRIQWLFSCCVWEWLIVMWVID